MFFPAGKSTEPTLNQAMNRRSGLPSRATLRLSMAFFRPRSMAVQGPPLSRYDMLAAIGLARTQNSCVPALAALNSYSASPDFLVAEIADEIAAGELIALHLVVPPRMPIHRRLGRILAFDPNRFGEGTGEGKQEQRARKPKCDVARERVVHDWKRGEGEWRGNEERGHALSWRGRIWQSNR